MHCVLQYVCCTACVAVCVLQRVACSLKKYRSGGNVTSIYICVCVCSVCGNRCCIVCCSVCCSVCAGVCALKCVCCSNATLASACVEVCVAV